MMQEAANKPKQAVVKILCAFVVVGHTTHCKLSMLLPVHDNPVFDDILSFSFVITTALFPLYKNQAEWLNP